MPDGERFSPSNSLSPFLESATSSFCPCSQAPRENARTPARQDANTCQHVPTCHAGTRCSCQHVISMSSAAVAPAAFPCRNTMWQHCDERLRHCRLACARLLGRDRMTCAAARHSNRGWVRSKRCNTCKPQDCEPKDCKPQAIGHSRPRGRLRARLRGVRAPAAPAPATRCMHQRQHSIRRQAHASVCAPAHTRVRFASQLLGRAHGQAREGCAGVDALTL